MRTKRIYQNDQIIKTADKNEWFITEIEQFYFIQKGKEIQND